MANDVFISYAHEEVSAARRLSAALVAARGWSVWWDTSLRTGEQYPRSIQNAVGDSRSIVVLWSKNSTTSDWVVAEASEGWNRKVLVPVLLDDSEPPLPFRQTQARNLSRWKGGLRDPAFLVLLDDIQRAHALGPKVSEQELAEREARRRAYQRRLWLRRAAYTVVAAAVLIGGWFGWRSYETHARVNAVAEQLASDADAVRAQVLKLTPEEQKRIWWTHLFEDSQRMHRLELSMLLAIEAVRHRHTEHTERTLRDSFALLPWADQQLKIDRDDLPLALDFNGDGRLLAAGGGMRGTRVWDLEHGTVIAQIDHGGTSGLEHWKDKRGTFSECRGSRVVIDFNPVRDELATAGPDATARIWDARSGRELHRLAHDELVTAVAYDSRGRWLASSDETGSICLWDAASGQQLHCMQQGAPTYWIGFSPSSALLVSVSRDGVVNIWQADSGALRQHITAGTGTEAARFDPAEKMLATFGADAATQLWSLETKAVPWKLSAQADGDAGVIFDTTGRTMVIGQTNGPLSWWDVTARSMRFSIPMGALYTRAMTAVPGARYLVSISADSDARAWELQSGRLLKRIPYAGDLMGLAVSPDGERFAVMGDDQDDRVIEITQIHPADGLAAACDKVGRNLTHNEWRQYLEAEPYRLTCPSQGAAEEEEEQE